MFLHFMHQPPPPAEGGAFTGALAKAGYVFPFIGSVFLLSGVLLLLNRAVGFALIILSPMVVNILLYHLRFDPAPAAIAPGSLIGLLMVILAYLYRDRFKDLFR